MAPVLAVTDFYEQWLYGYLLVSLLFALLLGRGSSASAQKEVVTGDRVIKKAEKGFALHFPQGMVAYCTYCARYLPDEEQASRHQSGKRHKENAAGATKWHEFRSQSEMQKVPKVPEAQPDSGPLDPEWETVEASKRKPKKQRKQS